MFSLKASFYFKNIIKYFNNRLVYDTEFGQSRNKLDILVDIKLCNSKRDRYSLKIKTKQKALRSKYIIFKRMITFHWLLV